MTANTQVLDKVTALIHKNCGDIWKCLEEVMDALDELYLGTRISLGFLARDDYDGRDQVYAQYDTERKFWKEVDATLESLKSGALLFSPRYLQLLLCRKILRRI